MNKRLLEGWEGAIALLPHAIGQRTAVALTLAVLTAAPAFSQAPSQSGHQQFSIEFTRIVDSTQGYRGFGDFPAINNHGEVAFKASRIDTGLGVFRSHPAAGKADTIASTMDGLDLFGDDVAINPDGVVVFDATTTTNSRAIFKGDGISRTLIADTLANGLSKFFFGSPSINAAGTVAFFAGLAQRGSPEAVFTGNGGPLTIVASKSAGGFDSFLNVAINDAGTVVFPATLSDGSRGVFTVSRAVVDIVDTNRHTEIDSFGDPVINNAGTVADVAFVLPLDAPQIFSGNARGISPRNDPTNPPFPSTEHPSINNSGAVAFSAIQVTFGGNGPTGIFLEVSGGQSLIPVIKPGDKLFGSTVDHVDLGRFALNDRFQMAFSYTLTDGTSGVAVASFNGEREAEEGQM